MAKKKATPEYEEGTIKVVWIQHDPLHIYSKMFDDIAEADKFGRTKGDYVIFSLVKQAKMEEFAWKLLPYGNYRLYTSVVGGYKKSKESIRTSKETIIDPVKKLLFP